MALEAHQLGDSAESALLKYCCALKEYDSHTNLVANSDLQVVLKEHVLDSLRLLNLIKSSFKAKFALQEGSPESSEKNSLKLVDIGSGAGFPALVLAIAMPNLKVTLIESIGKKCRFLESVAQELDLKRVRVICDRAEILGHERNLRERFEIATARAVGALPVVAELCIPFLKTGGVLLAQRSKRQALEEASTADAYASRLGAELEDTIHFEPDILGREMSVLLIKKTKSSPQRYPRSAAQMKGDKH